MVEIDEEVIKNEMAREIAEDICEPVPEEWGHNDCFEIMKKILLHGEKISLTEIASSDELKRLPEEAKIIIRARLLSLFGIEI